MGLYGNLTFCIYYFPDPLMRHTFSLETEHPAFRYIVKGSSCSFENQKIHYEIRNSENKVSILQLHTNYMKKSQ